MLSDMHRHMQILEFRSSEDVVRFVVYLKLVFLKALATVTESHDTPEIPQNDETELLRSAGHSGCPQSVHGRPLANRLSRCAAGCRLTLR